MLAISALHYSLCGGGLCVCGFLCWEYFVILQNDDAVKEKYIVEKILDMRIRRVKVEAKEQADSHLDAAEAGELMECNSFWLNTSYRKV